MKDLAPAEPIVRYEYARPGGLIDLDIQRLGHFEGVGHRVPSWERAASATVRLSQEWIDNLSEEMDIKKPSAAVVEEAIGLRH